MRPLTPKQERFVAEYLIDLNATQAAIRAGYSSKGANVTGSQLLAVPSIREEVGKRRRNVEVRALVTRDMVIRGLLELAESTDTPAAVRRAAWRDLGEHLAMFKLVVDHRMVAELAESLGLDAAEVQAEAEAILRGAR